MVTPTGEGDLTAPAHALALPNIFIDAGGVPWPELALLLRHETAELLPGEVLELQSGDPATISALPDWCDREGHALIHVEPGDWIVTCWIAKR